MAARISNLGKGSRPAATIDRAKRARRAGLIGWMGLIVLILAVGCGDDSHESVGPRSMLQSGTSDSAAATGPNRAPTIEAVVTHPVRPMPGRKVQVTARVSDLDDDPIEITYQWRTRSGRVLGEGRVFDTTGLGPGSRLEVSISATDQKATSPATVHSFQLAERASSIGLVVIDASNGTMPGVTLKGVVELSDVQSGRVEADLEWTVNGEVVGTDDELLTARFVPGDIVILRARLANVARPGRPISSPPITLSRGEAPRISSKPLSGIEGGLFRYQIRAASDESDAELTYALLSGPDGMRVDAKTGIVQWRPTTEQRGRFEIEVSATDQWGSGVGQSFAIDAAAPPASPR